MLDTAETIVEYNTSSLRSRRASDDEAKESGEGGAERGSAEGGVGGVAHSGAFEGGSSDGSGGGAGGAPFARARVASEGADSQRGVGLTGGAMDLGARRRGGGCVLTAFGESTCVLGEGVCDAWLSSRSIVARMLAARISARCR